MLAALILAGCVPLGMSTAQSDIDRAPPARPPVLQGPTHDRSAALRTWNEVRRPALRNEFEDRIYGPAPTELHAREISHRLIEDRYADGLGVLEEIEVHVGDGPSAPSFRIALALPRTEPPAGGFPLILGENFCGNRAITGAPGLSASKGGAGCPEAGLGVAMLRLIFGRHIVESPNEDILRRGYAYANVYPGEVVADGSGPGQAEKGLSAFKGLLEPDRRPLGAIAVWAATFGWALDVLEADPRLNSSRTAIYGHSRHGKAALLAAAFDPRIEAVIAHQSGRGGASLSASNAGETVARITASYPHWFAPAFSRQISEGADPSIDQHMLIAMIAPRPVLLGNGWRDVWSDPNGAFRAARGATPIYNLFGGVGLTQIDMTDTRTDGDIEYYIREGGHGVTAQDWARFLDFLDRRLK